MQSSRRCFHLSVQISKGFAHAEAARKIISHPLHQLSTRHISQQNLPTRLARTSFGSSLTPISKRQNSTASPLTNPRRSPPSAPRTRAEQEPAYELTFTCKPCKHRSAHHISKQGYHKGTVLITCPDCKNRHVISDHLKVRGKWILGA